MRIAVIMNMVSPATVRTFERLAETPGTDVRVLFEVPMEANRMWSVADTLPFDHAYLPTLSIDLRRLADDAFVHVPWRPVREIAAFGPDVVVGGGSGAWSSPANVAALAGRRRHRWAFAPIWGSFQRQSPTLARRAADPWVRRFVRASDAWIAYGARAKQELLRLGADASRTVVSPNVARPFDEGFRRVPRDLSQDGPRFVFLGQLIERKGVRELLDAFSTLASGTLTLAGDGPLRPLVDAAAQANPRISCVGHVDFGDLEALLARSDILVLPSRYEVWGLVVNEALSAGLPVVVSDQVGAADDLVTAGVNGVVFPAGSVSALAGAMREVAAWPEQRVAEAAAHSRRVMERWTIDAAVDGLLEAAERAYEWRMSCAS